MCQAWSSSTNEVNVRVGDGLTLSNLNFKFHTVVVFILFMFDDLFTVTVITRVFSSLTESSHRIFLDSQHKILFNNFLRLKSHGSRCSPSRILLGCTASSLSIDSRSFSVSGV